MQSTTVLKDPQSVASRLSELGLSEEALLHGVRQGHLASLNCTENHPPLLRGIVRWGESVKSLRDVLLTKGWDRSDTNNFSLVVNRDLGIAVAVATGDEGTGIEFGEPKTKSRKGPNTFDAVTENCEQLQLFPVLDQDVVQLTETPAYKTYFLLIYRVGLTVRSELSLPTTIGSNGRVVSWSERLLLSDIDGESEPLVPEALDLEDIEVEVKRRA